MSQEKSEKPYREGDDPEPTSGPTPPTSQWFTPDGTAPPPPPPSPGVDPRQPRPETVSPGAPTLEGEQFYTAVLIVQRHDGMVMPVTNLTGMNLHHLANPHEVLRMCADVQDQISSMRVIGETLRNTHSMMGQALAENSQRMLAALGVRPPPATPGQRG